jgi:thioredoxin-related protein
MVFFNSITLIGGWKMGTEINWEVQMDAALAKAKSQDNVILLDFHNPAWIGCQQMDAVTYPDADVINFINGNTVPLRVNFDAKPLSTEFNVKWTPTVITLDRDGKEHHRTVGFLAPEELIPSLLLGTAKVHFDSDQFETAITALEKILSGYPKSDSVCETIFLRGVSLYRSTGDPKPLKECYERLKTEYPDNEWTKRAYPYRLI